MEGRGILLQALQIKPYQNPIAEVTGFSYLASFFFFIISLGIKLF